MPIPGQPAPSVTPTESALSHVDSLPTLPSVAVRVLKAATDDRADADELARIIGSDQSLAVRILSIANSAIFGARTEVKELQQATVRLGFAMVRNVVLAVKVFACFPSVAADGAAPTFNRTEFWKHAIGVACAARRLAAGIARPGCNPEQAFLAGLLHDLGKVALDALFPRAYERVAAQAEMTRGDIADSERALLGIDHTIVGRRLAERWELPIGLREVIWLHHLAPEAMPARVESADMIALVQLADVVAREQRIGYSGNFAFYESSTALARGLGVPEQVLDACVQSIAADVAEYTSLLGLDRETTEAIYLKSLSGANAELGRLNTELTVSNQRLRTALRYYKAFAHFDQRLRAGADLTAVAAAMAAAAQLALQRTAMTAFAVHDPPEMLEVVTVTEVGADASAASGVRVDPELQEWLDRAGDVANSVVLPIPRPLQSALAAQVSSLPDSSAQDARPMRAMCWLVPIVHDGRLVGGLIYASQRDERAERTLESEDLRSFAISIGLAISRARAYAAAQRLSEDLAETNRRLQQVQAEVLRSRAVSMIAEMAAGAGHELNTPLAVISGRAQLLISRADDPQTRRVLEQVHTKAHECSRIVTELMEFARPAKPVLEPVDVGALLAEARDDWLKRSALPPSQLSLHPPQTSALKPQPSALIRADRGQVLQVLRELLENATDAIADSDGSITLACTVKRPVVEGRPQPFAAAWVEIVVRDGGCGMAPAVAQRAFDPFYSHRKAGRGRGLGLARAYRIVEAHAGRIWLESRPSEGTSVYVALPLAAET
jgi:signal transduction histidine kinase/HD-like signal output (HDOD) protein